MRSGKRRPSPGSGRKVLRAKRVSRTKSCASPRVLQHQKNCQEMLCRTPIAPDIYSLSERHQLRLESRHCRSAYENDTLQAEDINWCTLVSPTWLSATETQPSPLSSGALGPLSGLATVTCLGAQLRLLPTRLLQKYQSPSRLVWQILFRRTFEITCMDLAIIRKVW